jgi:F0F1-type ATP synthase assembly protein I
MTQDDDREKHRPPNEAEPRQPWWATDAPAEPSLPEGFPERPDIRKVEEMRERMRQERATREAAGRNSRMGKFTEKRAKQIKDIGSYTLIPTMMLAGPAVGYGLGWLLEREFGGKPWVSVVGVLMGLAAAFQQIILLLRKK